jgi:hypothetical protein
MNKEQRKIEINAICKINRALALELKGNIFEQIVKETVQEAINYAHSCEKLPSYNELHIEMKKLSDKLHTDAKQTEKNYFEAGFNYCHHLLDERLNK